MEINSISVNPRQRWVRSGWRFAALRPTDLDRVRGLHLFGQAAPETFRVATAGAHLQRFPANTTLLFEGDTVDFLYMLLEGQVELHGTWNDHETVMAILRPVSSFLLAAVVLDADALMSARTLERCEILMIPGDAIRTAMQLDARFAMAVSRDLAGGYRGLVRTIKNHKLRSGVERLANHLLALRSADNAGSTVRLHYEKRILASLLGMTPENLSRAFAALQAHGVTVEGALVHITNIAALEALAKPDPLIDNHAPRGGDILIDADAEIWSSEWNRKARR
ncbi:MAG: cyclic nucleotide-binding domain-containing protein [Proteobacteria bacterium]|nr:cyclic nucleotide-binding domain-containing protein [Pseudomonadota bacterium]